MIRHTDRTTEGQSNSNIPPVFIGGGGGDKKKYNKNLRVDRGEKKLRQENIHQPNFYFCRIKA